MLYSVYGMIYLSSMIEEPDSNKERKPTMRKLIALLLAAAMLLSMTACGSTVKSEEPTNSISTVTEVATEPVVTEATDSYSAQSEIDTAPQEVEAPAITR